MENNNNILLQLILTTLTSRALMYRRELDMLVNDKTYPTEQLTDKIMDTLQKLSENEISTNYWLKINGIDNTINELNRNKDA